MHKTYQGLKEPLRYCKKHTKQVGMLFASCNRHTKTSPFFTWHLAPLVLLWACQGSSDTYRASKKPERPSEALPHDTPKKDGENAWLWPRNDIYYNLRGWERNWESLSSPSLCHWVAGSGGLLNHWRATGKGVLHCGLRYSRVVRFRPRDAFFSWHLTFDLILLLLNWLRNNPRSAYDLEMTNWQ